MARILKDWNGDHQMSDLAPSVYYNLLSHVMFYAMKDELGAAPYKAIIGSSTLKNSYQRFVGNEHSPWWDDVRTKDKKETRREIVEKAAQRTLALLHETSGEKPEDWTWGKIHTLTHKHALGVVKPLDQFFNVGPFAAPGGDEVLNNLHFSLDTTGYFPVSGGPALRKMTDFGDLENGQTVSPTGQSGDVMSDHYDDQAEMFVSGKFRKMLMNEEAIRSSSGNKLLLKPR
jgi:penicillin amidase